MSTTHAPSGSSLVPAAPPETITRKHHKFGPSRLNYLSECSAFTSRSGTSDAADQGTFLHDLMEQLIKNVVKGSAKLTVPQLNDWLFKQHELTEEEQVYLLFCCRRLDAFLSKKWTRIETEINVEVHKYTPEGAATTELLNHGYLDVLIFFGESLAILIDFKFGIIPVKPAGHNLQGWNYVLGTFQKRPELQRIGVEFVQPKLQWVSSCIFNRTQMFDLYTEIATVIANAIKVQEQPELAPSMTRVGKYCDYCALNDRCATLANMRGVVATKLAGLPAPTAFKGLELATPEEVALARYWAELVETGLSEVKARAFELAEQNGGSISCTLPDGRVITYSIRERSSPRSLGSAVEVADALKEFVSPEEILGAADLAITKLEPICKRAFVEVAKLHGEKLTQKAAWEQAESILCTSGLLTRGDTKVRYLKLEQPKVKELEQQTK